MKNVPPAADAAEILANLVLNHVPVVNFNFRPKASPPSLTFLTSSPDHLHHPYCEASTEDSPGSIPPRRQRLLWKQKTRARWIVDLASLRGSLQKIQYRPQEAS